MDDILTALDEVLPRESRPRRGLYVASLNAAGLNKILEKVGEETTEVILAAKDSVETGNTEALTHEVADLCFPLMVMLRHLDLDHLAVLQVLDERMGLSGLEKKRAEKAIMPARTLRKDKESKYGLGWNQHLAALIILAIIITVVHLDFAISGRSGRVAIELSGQHE